jgi:DNA-binding NtrC family response regulator
LSRCLAERGYEVVCADDAASARAWIVDQRFDAAFIDLTRTARDPSAFARWRQLARLERGLPVVVATPRSLLDAALEATRRSACSYLVQPFGPDEAARHVERVLHVSRLEAELRDLRERVAEGIALASVERGFVAQALEREGDNQSRAASRFCWNDDDGNRREGARERG